MSDLIRKESNDCFKKQINPDTTEFECFFHYTDEKIFEAGFVKGYEFAKMQANDGTKQPKNKELGIRNGRQQSEQLVAFAMWLRKSESIGDAEILVNAYKEAINCGTD